MAGRGSMSAFVACLVSACVPCLALVVDGGQVVVAYADAADHCQNAARLAAQNVVGIRAGNPRVDAREGVRDARSYMSDAGLPATVTVDGPSVRVTVEKVVRLPMLSLIGVGSTRVRVSRSALLAEG